MGRGRGVGVGGEPSAMEAGGLGQSGDFACGCFIEGRVLGVGWAGAVDRRRTG